MTFEWRNVPRLGMFSHSQLLRYLLGSLIRGGPLPFIQRIVNADEYEQGVYKFMAQDGCDRKVNSLKSLAC